jgi:MoxR-like ATPase
MGLLVGEPGAGKTFTLRCFTEELNPALSACLLPPFHRDSHGFLPGEQIDAETVRLASLETGM